MKENPGMKEDLILSLTMARTLEKSEHDANGSQQSAYAISRWCAGREHTPVVGVFTDHYTHSTNNYRVVNNFSF